MYYKRIIFASMVIFILMTAVFWNPVYAAPEAVKSTDGISIAYQVKGKGDTALVFVHCWCCDKGYWDAQVPYFAGKYKVVTLDLAGHGESGLHRQEWTIKAYGEDVAAVVNILHLKRVILIGHSMGGGVIAEAARLLPKQVIGLVGVDTFLNVELKYTREQFDQFTAPMRKDFAKGARSFLAAVMFTPETDPQLKEKIISDMISAPPEVALASMEAGFKHDLPAVLDDVKVPVRCINADKFPTDIEAGKRHTVSFEVILMPGHGHFLYMEDPKTFNRLLQKAINTLLSTL